MSYRSIADHQSMAFDDVRNRAYEAALRRVIRPTSTVLDLGAGVGVLGLMAARLGARRVYLVEPEDVVAVAAEVARSNGLGDVVRCLQGRIEDVRSQIPERVDVIVSVFTGNFLLHEDLLPSLFHARDHLLAPGGVLIPSAGRMEAVPVSAPDVHRRLVGAWSTPTSGGIDLQAARSYAANAIAFRASGVRDAVWLAAPQSIGLLDFREATDAGIHAECTYEITQSGVCHGWLGWFSMDLAGEWLSTSPRDPETHWSQAYLPLDPPIALEAGQRVTFAIDRAPFAEWAWRVRTDAGAQSHSTLLAVPLAPSTLRRARPDFAPDLTRRGHAVREILDACDGVATIDTIASAVFARHPEQFRDKPEALALVRDVVKRYA